MSDVLSTFTWESYRRKDGSLDLLAALMARAPKYPGVLRVRKATDFIDEVEALCLIRNPEAAAIVVAHALRIIRGE